MDQKHMRNALRTVVICKLAVVVLSFSGCAEEEKSPAPKAGKTSSDATIKACDEFIASQSVDKSKKGWNQKLSKPPKFTFTEGVSYIWHIETNKGRLLVELMPKVAPMHVSSTIYLSRIGFYDGIKFHRVIPDFMAQGGCPLGTGTGGPGYEYDGEFDPSVKHTQGGLLSMANRGPGTDGSQFFLTFKATPWLDDKHTIFGKVIEGTDVLKTLESLGTPGRGTPKSPLLMNRTWISVR